MSRVVSAVAVIAAMVGAVAIAAEPDKKVKYVAPAGFAGHAWGELRTNFTRLPDTPIGVGAAWMNARVKSTTFDCIPVATIGPQMSGAIGGCDFRATLDTLRKTYEGGGFYVLSEYSLDEQGFRFGDSDPVVLHPVVYQFCANWYETKRESPPKFDEMNKFCGMRLMFRSETREELKGKPLAYVTNYDRVFDKLLAKFGRPSGYQRRGRVLIETLEGDSGDAGDRRFEIRRWCPSRDGSGMRIGCDASVTLALDPTTGVGTVLYSAPMLWEFAYARRLNGNKDDRLYKMLHARE
jgi:hypothetical protein